MNPLIVEGQVWYEDGDPGYTVLILRPCEAEADRRCGDQYDYWECLVTFSDGSVMVDPGLRLTIDMKMKHPRCTLFA